MRYLGIDPGLKATGYALLEPSRQRVVLSGLCRPKASLSRPERLAIHRRYLLKVLDNVEQCFDGEGLAIALESPFVGKFASAALALGEVRGVLLEGLDFSPWFRGGETELLDVPPPSAKRALGCKGNAKKEVVQAAAAALYRPGTAAGVVEDWGNEHVCDAVAVAHTAYALRGTPEVVQLRLE